MSKLNRRQMLSTTAAVGSALAAAQVQAEDTEKEINVGKRIRRVPRMATLNTRLLPGASRTTGVPMN